MFLYIHIVLLLEIPAAVLGVTVNQGPKVLVKEEGKTVYLPCKATGLGSSDYIHWYQMKDGEAPSRLLYISQRGDVTRDTNNPQANDFTVDKTKLYDLKLSDIQKSHAAVYFCAYWIYISG
uniref:T cell receptor gamma variable 1 n=2 Tax=Cyprinus carpio TaxID=7962 RepID=A0A8C2C023_CYPCA